jgi:acyl-CoA thioester hydrolase
LAVFSTDVSVRWSDMDVFGHVNNACVVTLLEEARTELLFGEGTQRGAQGLAKGVVVVELLVRYRQPLVYSASPVRVQLWVSELRAASSALEYTVAGTDANAVVARTKLAPYDITAQRPRRLMPAEHEFLSAFRDDGADD